MNTLMIIISQTPAILLFRRTYIESQKLIQIMPHATHRMLIKLASFNNQFVNSLHEFNRIEFHDLTRSQLLAVKFILMVINQKARLVG